METEAAAEELAALLRGSVPASKPHRSVTPAPTLSRNGRSDRRSLSQGLASRRATERRLCNPVLPVARASGTVVGIDGRPAPNSFVLCQVKDPNPVLPPNGVPTSFAGADGAFSCSALAPAQYRLYARVVPQPAGSAAALWGWVDVSVAGQDISNLVIRATGRDGHGTDRLELLRPVCCCRLFAIPDPAHTGQFDLARESADHPGGHRRHVSGGRCYSGRIPSGHYSATVTGPGSWSLRSAMFGDKDLADVRSKSLNLFRA
jgi:hypothetical protein